MDRQRLILASASPRRHALLRDLFVDFDIIPSHLSEPAAWNSAVPPRCWSEALAYFKARSVADLNPDRWVLGADTIVACCGQVLGKPRDEREARAMLELQAGVESTVITGLSFVCVGRAEVRIIASDVTHVWMRQDLAAREAYLESGEWSGKAGAYGIQDVGDRLVQRIAGEFDNVVGLPRRLLRRMADAVAIA